MPCSRDADDQGHGPGCNHRLHLHAPRLHPAVARRISSPSSWLAPSCPGQSQQTQKMVASAQTLHACALGDAAFQALWNSFHRPPRNSSSTSAYPRCLAHAPRTDLGDLLGRTDGFCGVCSTPVTSRLSEIFSIRLFQQAIRRGGGGKRKGDAGQAGVAFAADPTPLSRHTETCPAGRGGTGATDTQHRRWPA